MRAGRVAHEIENKDQDEDDDEADHRAPKMPAQLLDVVAERHPRFGKEVFGVLMIAGAHVRSRPPRAAEPGGSIRVLSILSSRVAALKLRPRPACRFALALPHAKPK